MPQTRAPQPDASAPTSGIVEGRVREDVQAVPSLGSSRTGMLHARPRIPGLPPLAPGQHALALGSGSRDGFLSVPVGLDPGRPAPLLVFFHGAGGNAHQADLLQSALVRQGVLLLSIDSRGTTWDLIESDIGPDVAFLDRALRWTFERFAVDSKRVGVGGFSDGASYALSVGLANGALFRHVLAFSPGFLAPPELEGKPRVYISHGTNDGVLPIDSCSRRIVPTLEHEGYNVRYREFNGPHTVPEAIAREAIAWLVT